MQHAKEASLEIFYRLLPDPASDPELCTSTELEELDDDSLEADDSLDSDDSLELELGEIADPDPLSMEALELEDEDDSSDDELLLESEDDELDSA